MQLENISHGGVEDALTDSVIMGTVDRSCWKTLLPAPCSLTFSPSLKFQKIIDSPSILP